MSYDRTVRLNSLLREVLSEVIRKEVKNPNVSEFVTVTKVSITKDLRHAKVYVSIIGNEEAKKETLAALSSAKGFIAVSSAKKVRMHHFPELTFLLDNSVEKQLRIDALIHKVSEERNSRIEPNES